MIQTNNNVQVNGLDQVEVKKLLPFFIVFTVYSTTLCGQSSSLPEREISITESEYTVQRIYNTDHGLPANGTTAVLQDRNGYIWASTFNGLVRYDGSRFKVYNMDSVEGLPSNRFLTVYEGTNGEIYSGMEHGGLLVIHENNIEVYHLDQDLYGFNISIYALYEDETGTLWIGTESGIFHFLDGEFTRIESELFEELPVIMTQMIYSYDGVIHILFSNALLKYDSDNNKYIPLATYNRDQNSMSFLDRFETSPVQVTGNYRQIDQKGEQEFLLLHEEGIFELSESGIRAVLNRDELETQVFNGFIEFNDRTYVYGSNGLYSTDDLISRQPEFTRYNDISISFLLQDHEGSLWLSTHAYGLIHLKETPVYSGDRFDPISDVPVTAVLGGSDGKLYTGTNCDALYAFDEDGFEKFGTESGIRNRCIWSLLEESDGTLWVGTWGDGVFYRNPGSERFEAFSPEIMQDANAIMAMFEDSNGNIWIGSYFNGLYMYDGEQVQKVLNSDGRELSAVRMIYEDTDGQLYFATDQGIGILNSEFQVDKPEELKLPSTPNFRTITNDAQGRFWFGSYGGGILILDGARTFTLTTENGLFDNTVSQLNFDGDGNLWLAGNLGVYIISSSEIEPFFSGDTNQVRVSRLGRNDGLYVSETTGGFTPSSYLNEEGELFIPTVRGLAKIDISRFEMNWSVPKVYLDEVEVDGVVYRPEEIDHFSYDDRRIIFRFSVLSYKNPDDVNVEYRFEGFEREWQRASESREAIYTTLPHGRYTLRVRGSNNDGIWNEEGVAFSFVVTPPFWLTRWFYLLIGLLFVGCVYLIYRYRMSTIKRTNIDLEKKVERRTKELKAANIELKQLVLEKNKMQRVLGHDLRNPLSGIIGYLELLKSEGSFSKNEEHAEIMKTLLESSRDAINLLENLLHFAGSTDTGLKPVFNNENIPELAEEAIKIAEVQASQKNIEVKLENETDVWAEVDKNMILSLLRNLISNAVKYSLADSTVKVNIEEAGSNFQLTVSDHGVGMSPEKVNRLFTDQAGHSQLGTMGEKGMGIGLQICKDFVDKHKGTIDVQSEPGKGSTFMVKLPGKQGR